MKTQHTRLKTKHSTTNLSQLGLLALACITTHQAYAETLSNTMKSATNAVYNELKDKGCNDFEIQATSTCNSAIFGTWVNVRALVHTANQLAGSANGQNGGPTNFSLGIKPDDLVAALRWNAGEEYSAQHNALENFSHIESATLRSRVNSLYQGNKGFSLNGNAPVSGMNAGDSTWSALGGFLNLGHQSGNLNPSDNEDAFDFSGTDISGGLDYRLNNHWTLGGMLIYNNQDIDFDATKSAADATVAMTGISLTSFLLYQTEHWYATASLGYQSSEFDTNRSVRYTSSNPLVPTADTVAISNNNAHSLNTSISAGYSVDLTPQWTLEPSLTLNHQQVTIEQFKERDTNNSSFNLLVYEQQFNSLEAVAALKLQYVFSNDYGVFTPFIELQNVSQNKAKARRIDAVYANIANTVSTAAHMQLFTDNLESNYSVFGLGVATVLRGASQKTLGAEASGGIQAFIHYHHYLDAGNYHQQVISGGLRYEF
jgi:uncharacterized protein with beta-barrel porin domain